MFGSKPVELDIVLEQQELFLHPFFQTEELVAPPTTEAIIRGQVVLRVKKDVQINSLVVTWEVRGSLCAGERHPHETWMGVKKEIRLELDGEVQRVGEHRFDFSFPVPPNTEPHERSVYGSVRHTVNATATLPGVITNDRIRASLPISMILNVYGAGQPIKPLESTAQDINDDLGALAIKFTAGHASVSSPVFIEFHLLSPPDIEIQSLEAFVAQRCSIKYANGNTVDSPLRFYRMFKIDKAGDTSPAASKTPDDKVVEVTGHQEWSNSARIEQPTAGKQWFFRRIGRCPHDDFIRPTTHPASDTLIRFSHRLAGKVVYIDRRDGREKECSLATPAVTLSSCCAMYDSLQLPCYSKETPTTPPPSLRLNCQCHRTFQDLVDRDIIPPLQEDTYRPGAGLENREAGKGWVNQAQAAELDDTR